MINITKFNNLSSPVFSMFSVNEKIGSARVKNLFASNLQTRCFYSSRVESTPLERIQTHLSLKEPQRLKMMYDIYFKSLPKAEQEKFELGYGSFKSSTKYLREVFNYMVEYQKKSYRSPQHSGSYWATKTIKDAECLPGYGTRYSSPSALLVGDNLPKLLRKLNKHITSIVEVGGFTFNDLFLFYKSLTEAGIHVPQLTGIDINQHGKIAAEKFNEEIAKIENFQIHLCDASTSLPTCANPAQYKLLIALRLLAVLEPEQVFPFFRQVQSFLKEDELFIFNYSEYNEVVVGKVVESLQKQKRKGWTITHCESPYQGMHVLKQNNVLEQTFFEKQFFENPKPSGFLNNFDFQLMDSPKKPENPGFEGTAHLRGQQDPYQRVLMFSLKKNRLRTQ